jgi:hypothetical protein
MISSALTSRQRSEGNGTNRRPDAGASNLSRALAQFLRQNLLHQSFAGSSLAQTHARAGTPLDAYNVYSAVRNCLSDLAHSHFLAAANKHIIIVS